MVEFPSAEGRGSRGSVRGSRRQATSRRPKKNSDGNTVYLQVIAACCILAVLWFASIELRYQVQMYRIQQAIEQIKQ